MATQEQSKSYKLYLGDCIEILPTLAAGSVDAVITDPPYGIGFNYYGNADVANNPDYYWMWFNPIFREIMYVLKPGGFMAIWQPQRYFKHFWDWYGDDIHIYCAAKNFVQLRKTAINYGYDPIVMLYKQGETPKRPMFPKRNIDYFVANTAAIVSDPDRPERQHPCPRPLDAVIEMMSNFSVGIVLDPFMGSGTTGVACMKLGRNFIGIEKEPKYFEIAKRRIEQAAAQMLLPFGDDSGHTTDKII